MKAISMRGHRWSPPSLLAAAGFAILLVLASLGLTQTSAHAQASVDLGTADSFAVLAGASVTNTGPSVITGDVGVSPGSSVTGFPPGEVNGTIHIANAEALQAKSDLVDAYNDAAERATDAALPPDAGGLTLVPGVYTAPSTLGLTGTLTLDAEEDPDAVFIFQVGSALTTAPNSEVALINGAQACNVFWQVGSSATLDTNTTFVGNILALTSITANTGATVDGRLLARNGSVTLDTNVIQRAECDDDDNGNGDNGNGDNGNGDNGNGDGDGDNGNGDNGNGDNGDNGNGNGDNGNGDNGNGDNGNGDNGDNGNGNGDNGNGDGDGNGYDDGYKNGY